MDRRGLRRTLLPLLLAAAIGTAVALALGAALDRAVTDRAERDLYRTLELLEPEMALVCRSGEAANPRVASLASTLGVRVTLVSAGGEVLADSAVDSAHLRSVENHGGRPEIVEARRSGVGAHRRRSATVAEPFLYVARRLGSADAPAGYLRFAVSPSELERAERPFRRATDLVAAGAGLATGLALLLARRRHASELVVVHEAVAAAARGETLSPAGRLSEETDDVLSALGDFARLVREERAGTREARAFAQKVFEGVPVGLVLLDRSCRVLAANPAFQRLAGLCAPIPSGGTHLVELLRSRELSSLLTRGLAGGRVEREPVRLERPEGAPLVVEVSLFPLPEGTGTGPVAIGVLRDATERDRLEGLRRRFVADVSHELRTPLASIRAAAETLEEEAAVSEAGRRMAGIVHRNAANVEALLDDLTDLSLIESGAVALKEEDVELPGLLGEVRDDLAAEASRRGIDVALDAPPGLAARGDRRRLAEVFRNLLDNALKFSPDGSRVDVTASSAPEAGQVVVEVRDRGIGIPPAERENVFQRFYRVDPSRSKATPGSGLGLAIVKHLVLLHGGSVHVDSRTGEGSTFRVGLPAGQPPRSG